MKKFLRAIFVNLVTLAIVAAVFPGLSYGSTFKNLLFAALIFTLINLCLQPLIRLLLLPLNLLTLGMFRWLSGAICLLFLTLFLPEIKIVSFQMPGINQAGFIIPSLYFSTSLSLITVSLLLSFVSSFLAWLLKN